MFRITGYHKMQIGLGVLLVVAVLLTLVAVAWPMMTVQAGGSSPYVPGGGIQPDGCVHTYWHYEYLACGTCGWAQRRVEVYKAVEDPCSGWGPVYYYDHSYCVWC